MTGQRTLQSLIPSTPAFPAADVNRYVVKGIVQRYRLPEIHRQNRGSMTGAFSEDGPTKIKTVRTRGTSA